MEMDSENTEIKEWFQNFITLFREKYSQLSEFEKSGIDNTLNFLKPCQIEVFWLKNPELQLIVQSNMPERKDLECIIHGPFEGREFYDKVEPILSEERWQKKIEEKDFEEFVFTPDETLPRLLAMELHQMLEYAKFILFYPHDVGDSGGAGSLTNNVYAHIHVGNISNKDYKKRVEQSITQMKHGAELRKDLLKTAVNEIKDRFQLNEPFKHSAVQIQKKGGYGFGVHMFPPVIIGKPVKPTIRQLLEGVRTDTTIFNKAFDLKIENKRVIVNRDGYIFIETPKKEEALNVLNTIMALSTLLGNPLFAVREQDISTASYNENFQLTSKQWNSQTIRSRLHDHSSIHDLSLNHERTEILQDWLTPIIKESFTIMKNRKLSEDLKFFVEAFTHNHNTEYSQSFVMSWSVIERYFLRLWKNVVSKKKLDKKRSKKLKSWKIDQIMETMDLSKIINEEDFKILMELKNERNQFYHGGHQISRENSAKCLNFVRKIINKKLDF